MLKFEVKQDFMINDKPVKIRSGAVHYFRIAPSQWQFTLEKMKAAGLNTVETYVPWNVHEPSEGEFDFEGVNNLRGFIELAQQVGLYVIVRPSPYICAEWEFGGLPAWLLKYPDMIVRTNTPRFMEKVANYYKVLFTQLVPLQYTYGGPILMMQVENEYGSFGNDKDYLRQIKKLMEENGVDVPLFTSDGGWEQALTAGSLIDDDVLVTANFGSHIDENLHALKKFMDAHGKKWPLMCMEFWDGWFNRWDEKVIKRDADDFGKDLKDLIDGGASFNLYMFRGGSNWGFLNGCSSRDGIDLPQITSYDYDAVLHEDGTNNEKYKVLCALLDSQKEVEDKAIKLSDLPKVQCKKQISLVNVLDDLATKVISSKPKLMEEIGSGYGYIFYRTLISGKTHDEKLKLVDATDRADIFLNQKRISTQYQSTLGKELKVDLRDNNELTILIENMGRVNYGSRLLSPTQRKGIRTGVMVDRHFHFGWEQWALDFRNVRDINWFSEDELTYGPTLNRFDFELDQPFNTYLDCSKFGKGIVLVNGYNIGRYWSVGPTQSLYIPSDVLKAGNNTIVVFETTDKNVNELSFERAEEVDTTK